jgi:hypothetical protein
VKSFLRRGENVIEITASNMPPDEGRLVSVKTDQLPDADSPAGLLLYAYVRSGDEVLDFVSDRSWAVQQPVRQPTTTIPAPPVDEKAVVPPPRNLGPAVELGGVELAPWRIGQHFLDMAAAPKDTLPVQRASLVFADPLMIALGRPNREQVITVRQTTATTLQALELTNGATLAKWLKKGTDNLQGKYKTSDELIDALYRQTISRLPTPAERKIALDLLGSPTRCEGIEDLLWALTMLPEFQLIH